MNDNRDYDAFEIFEEIIERKEIKAMRMEELLLSEKACSNAPNEE